MVDECLFEEVLYVHVAGESVWQQRGFELVTSGDVVTEILLHSKHVCVEHSISPVLVVSLFPQIHTHSHNMESILQQKLAAIGEVQVS